MDNRKFSAGRDAAHRPEAEDPHPHACLDGYVYLAYVGTDPETGEETEQIERLPCRRCAEAKEDARV